MAALRTQRCCSVTPTALFPPAAIGPCNWTQGISYYGDDQDTHYNALQAKFTKTFSQGSQHEPELRVPAWH